MIEIPGYRIVQPLGRGGMATVYLAIQESLDRHVALKVLSRHLSGEHTFNDRFLREARIAARSFHRSIVQIHDINAHDGRPFIAMEYLPGGTLGARLPEMALKDKLVVVAEIADALDFMHRQSIIHRDVKPDNIIFRADNSPVITDFGIARAANSATRMTLTGSILGTPHYMSPEQVRGKKIEPRSDLYSLGIVLFKMLTGHVPYDAEDQFSICAMHINDPVPRLPDDIAFLQGIVDRLLAKDPADRFQTGALLSKELEAAAGANLFSRQYKTPGVERAVAESSPEKSNPSITDHARLNRLDNVQGNSDDANASIGSLDAAVPRAGPKESAEPTVHSPSAREPDEPTILSPKKTGSDEPTGTRSEKGLESIEFPSDQASIPPQQSSESRRIRTSDSERLEPPQKATTGSVNKKKSVQRVVWVPVMVGIALISGLVWTMINQQPSAPPSGTGVNQQAPPSGAGAVAADDNKKLSQITLGPVLREIVANQPTLVDWIWIAHLRTLEADGEIDIDVNDWPNGPSTIELGELLFQRLDEEDSPHLEELAGAGVTKWQSLAPDAGWQPTQSSLLMELEEFARSVASSRFEGALTAARNGNWEGPEGAWQRFAAIYRLMPFEDQRENAIIELRQVWLGQWKSRLDEQSFDKARSLYRGALEAGFLGDAWLSRQRQTAGDLAQKAKQVAEDEQIEVLLAQAEQALDADRLMIPTGNNAYENYQQILDLEPENADAKAGIRLIAVRYTQLARSALDQGNHDSADQYLARARQLAPDLAQLAGLEKLLWSLEASGGALAESSSGGREIPSNDLRDDESVETLTEKGEGAARADQRRSMISAARTAIRNENFDAAERAIKDLIAFGADPEFVAQLRRSLEDAERYAGFEPGQLFQDGLGDGSRYGPVMVVVPSGSFLMGSPENERDRIDNEGPRFRVTFDHRFAMSRTEITVAEFGTFVDATGYTTDAERRGNSRAYIPDSGHIAARPGVNWRDDFKGDPADGNLPVVHVSWNDAKAYVEWLARETDRPYRLPSEAEFEYALRAGSRDRYWWGDGEPRDPVENVTGDGDRFGGVRIWDEAFSGYSDGFWGPAPVGSLEANPFGVFDMGGNVMEWVEDCWHDSYAGAPSDGEAWVNPGCNRRVIRGAQWSSTPEMARSAFRLSATTGTADARVGFRVARDL